MRLFALSLFERTNSRHAVVVNLAAWHWRRSLTWSWILSLRIGRSGVKTGFHHWGTNGGRQWVLNTPMAGLQWHRQRPMWRAS